MNRHCLIFITFCLLSLAGCATEPSQPHLSATDSLLAQSYTQGGQHKQAAELYQSLAQSKPAHQDHFNLLAAEALIKSGDTDGAQNHLNRIQPSALSTEQRNHLNLLAAQISLSHGDAEKALNQLNIIPSYSLKLNNKIIFYQSLAFAHSLTGNLLQCAQARIQLTPLLDDTQQRHANSKVILNTLSLLPSQTLILQQPPAPNVLGGWMALSRILNTRKSSYDQTQFQSNLYDWKRVFPEHPANNDFLADFSQQSIGYHFSQASAIALFLPESGRHAKAAQVIKEGFKTAYQNSIYQPALRFYDSSSGNIINSYQQAIAEGAKLIVGPLSKDKIQELALSTELTIPVLALNHISNLSANNLFQFGLSPIDEAMQLTLRARNDGHEKALLLIPENKKGYRAANYLTEYWEEQGGKILNTQAYTPKSNDFSTSIKTLLNLNESKSRYKQLRRFLGTNIQFTERRRQDVDALFLAASAKTARSIYPQLRFYRATRLPVYSLPQIYNGRPSPAQDVDLNSITFCDIPWLFSEAYPGELSQNSLDYIWQQYSIKYLRLFALGLDAFNVIDHLNQLNSSPYNGASGTLSINLENRITRQLVCAKFINGQPKLLDPIDDQLYFESTPIFSEEL